MSNIKSFALFVAFASSMAVTSHAETVKPKPVTPPVATACKKADGTKVANGTSCKMEDGSTGVCFNGLCSVL